MQDIKDCKGRLACKADAATGAVEQAYKGCKTSTQLPVGGSLTIERDAIVTVITRISPTNFQVDSHPLAA